MNSSITQFTEPLQQKTIEQIFSDKEIISNEEYYQSIIIELACADAYVNQNFVKDWIQFTLHLQKKLIDIQGKLTETQGKLKETQEKLTETQGKLNHKEVQLKREQIVGTKTTYELLQQDSTTPINFQNLLIRDKIRSIQQHIKQKKDQIIDLKSVDLQAAKIDSADNIRQTEQLLQQLKEYDTDLLNRSSQTTSSFQVQSLIGSQNISELQTLRLQQYTQNTDNLTQQE